MTRLYDALQQAGADQSGRDNVVDFPEVAGSTYSPTLTAKLQNLYVQINREVGGVNGKFVQLIAPRCGTGTTRVSRALAAVCTAELGKRVLIVDADAGIPQFCHYGIQPRTTWADTLRREDLVTDACHAVGRTGIFLMKAWRDVQGPHSVLASPGFEESLDDLRGSFDLIIVDSAAVEDSPAGIDIASVVDGSILVVGAEKTKWQVAADVRNRIEARGGQILGVLLNELRFHIPARIYDRL